MGLAELKADINIVRERLAGLSSSEIDVKQELTENILPLLSAMVDEQETAEAELADLGDTIDELVEQSGDALHPETATKIMEVVGMGMILAKEIEVIFAKGRVDDLTKKRLKPVIKKFRTDATVVSQIIAEITIPDDPEEPDEDEDEEIEKPIKTPAPAEGDEIEGGESGDEDDDDDLEDEIAAEER